MEIPFRCGNVAIAGLPNVGKSTLLNSLLGRKLSITSPKPQTTRISIKGIKTTDSYQIIYVDTPGCHVGGSRVDKLMIHETSSAVLSVDIVCLLAEPTKNKKSEMYLLLEKIAAGGIPTILALSKSDIYSRKELLDAADKYSGFGNFQHIIPISARQGENIEKLEQLIVDSLPISQPLYTPEQITTQTDLFLTAEFIREQIFLLLHQELPYTIFVETDLIENTDDAVQIDATIIVSKENHKPMVLGKGGKMLKEIGTRARKELKAHFGKNVHLNLWVKIGNTEDAYL